MKRVFLGLMLASALMACNQSNQTTAANGATAITVANAPVMKFDNDVHDFGKITSGDKVSFNFTFVNTGKTPLIITDAMATCGCTRPEWSHAPIKPGEKSAIKVSFNSAGKKGIQDKQITITANTIPAQNLVHLVGEVLEKK